MWKLLLVAVMLFAIKTVATPSKKPQKSNVPVAPSASSRDVVRFKSLPRPEFTGSPENLIKTKLQAYNTQKSLSLSPLPQNTRRSTKTSSEPPSKRRSKTPTPNVHHLVPLPDHIYLIQKYQIITQIRSHDKYRRTFIVQDLEDDSFHIIKVYDLNEVEKLDMEDAKNDRADFAQERFLLHKQIVDEIDMISLFRGRSYVSPIQDVFMAYEYALLVVKSAYEPGGSLANRHITPSVLAQIIYAMVGTQLAGATQRNIHGGNVLIGSDGYIKIGNFDSAQWTENPRGVASEDESVSEFEQLAHSLQIRDPTMRMILEPTPPPELIDEIRKTSHETVHRLMENAYFIENGVVWQDIVNNFGRSADPPFSPIRPEEALKSEISTRGGRILTFRDIFEIPKQKQKQKQKLTIPDEMRALYKPLFRSYKP